MIDSDGFRPNVGIILANSDGRVLWAKRRGESNYQFPQGGIKRGETPEQALYRELDEELGLAPHHVRCLGVTRDWLYYRLPRRFVRRGRHPVCIGQKQRWFALRFVGHDDDVRVDRGDYPEFDGWRWESYWLPLQQVIAFKREVYRQALSELAPLFGQPPTPPESADPV